MKAMHQFSSVQTTNSTEGKRRRRRRQMLYSASSPTLSTHYTLLVSAAIFLLALPDSSVIRHSARVVEGFVSQPATTKTSIVINNGYRFNEQIHSKRKSKPVSLGPTPSKQRSLSSKLHLSFESFDQVLYNIQSAAASLSSLSLSSSSGGNNNIITSLPVMYGAGLLTSVSPCVWGLLPLTMSYISTAAGERSDKQTTIPTIVFALGLASVFCTMGLVAVEVGNGSGAVFGSNAGGDDSGSFFVTALSSGVCLIMGLQLLNLITLPSIPKPPKDMFSLPFQSSSGRSSSSGSSSNEPILLDVKGNILSENDEGDNNADGAGSLLKTFFLGGSTALVSSPCATPVLTSILAFVANTHNPILGASYLLCYTLGYSTPLLLVSATGGQLLTDIKNSGVNGDNSSTSNIYGKIGPWVSPFTAGILLWYGTNGLLTSVFGDPSMAGLLILD